MNNELLVSNSYFGGICLGGNVAVHPGPIHHMEYEDAIIYCRFCNANGYTDWRMPTLDELVAISNCDSSVDYLISHYYNKISRRTDFFGFWYDQTDIFTYNPQTRYPGISEYLGVFNMVSHANHKNKVIAGSNAKFCILSVRSIYT